MTSVKDQLRNIINQAYKTNDIIFVFGDLQVTPNNSKKFYYGSCKIPKHPLGIIKLCEGLGLACTIFQHIETLQKPIVSRHGSK